MESGKFRKKRKNFAQVSNTALMDKNLSMKAKGLFAMIEAYMAIPDFTLYKQTLINASTEGEKAFDSAWKELKDQGYLKQYKIQTQKGFVYEYDLLDEPNDDKNGPGPDNDGNTENPESENFPTPPKRRPGEPTSGERSPGKQGSINISLSNNTLTNNNISNNNENNINNSGADLAGTDSVDVKQRNEYILKADKLAKQNLQTNKDYQAVKDPEVDMWVREEPEVMDYARVFDEKYTGKSTNCYMYDLSDILNTYLRFSSGFKSNKIPLAAKDLMDEVLTSFVSPKDMLMVLELSPYKLNKIYLCALKIVEDNGEIHNRQGYMAQIVRSIAAGKDKEEQGGQ